MLTRGLTEQDGFFKKFDPDMKERDLRVGLVCAVAQGSGLVFYKIALSSVGGTLLDNGLYANPVAANSKVVPYTVDGTLLAGGLINQLRDGGAFIAPLASSVESNTILVVELTERYKASTPSLTVSLGDLFENDVGTDSVINWVGSARLTLTSDGVSTWSL